MVNESDRILPESLAHGEEFPVLDIINALRGYTEEQKWSIIEHEIQRAVDIMSQGEAVRFCLVDETPAGGPHVVQTFYNPRENRASLEIPQEPLQRGGRFPTILHGLEILVTAIGLANQHEKPFENEGTIYPLPQLPFPQIDFVPILGKQRAKFPSIIVPLNVAETAKANIIAIHPGERHIDPETVARGYWHLLQKDVDLPIDLLRHTMLYQQLPGQRSKGIITVSVVPKEDRAPYKLMNPSRITEWDESDANKHMRVRRAKL